MTNAKSVFVYLQSKKKMIGLDSPTLILKDNAKPIESIEYVNDRLMLGYGLWDTVLVSDAKVKEGQLQIYEDHIIGTDDGGRHFVIVFEEISNMIGPEFKQWRTLLERD